MTTINFNIQDFVTNEAVNVFITSFGSWELAIGAALMASSMLLAFIYLMGVLLRSQSLVNFVKFEIYELIVTAILIVLIVSVIRFMANLDVSFVFPHAAQAQQGLKFYEATQQYYEEVQLKFEGWLNVNFLFAAWIDNLASVTPYARPLGIGIVAAPLAGFAAPLKQMLYNVNTALSIGYIITIAQLTVLQFAVVAFLKFYLPIGIFLRSFTPTRRIGGSLIAISLGFLFILPLMTILGAEMVLGANGFLAGADRAINTVINVPSNEQLVTDPNTGAVQNPNAPPRGGTVGTAFVYDEDNVKSLAGSLWDYTFGAFASLGNLFQKYIAGNLLFIVFVLPLHIVGIAFAIGYLLPALNVLVLVQAVKQMSRSLGEEVDISALTRLI